MELILLQDVETLGKEGDIVRVKDGYARNYLIPKKLAVPSTSGAVKILEAKRKRSAAIKEKEKEKAREFASLLSKLSLTIPVESGVNEMLFGSVTPDTISHVLQQEGIKIDKKNIDIKEPIKKLGVYNIEVKLHPEVKADVRVWVVKK